MTRRSRGLGRAMAAAQTAELVLAGRVPPEAGKRKVPEAGKRKVPEAGTGMVLPEAGQ